MSEKNKNKNGGHPALISVKATLITNISFVQMENIRLQVNALLISENDTGIFDRSWRIRGFGPDAAWEIFSMSLKKEDFPFSLGQTKDVGGAAMLGADDKLKPIFSGAILLFTPGPKFFLQIEDNKKPFDICKFSAENEEGHLDYPAIWKVLEQKTREYWTAPGFPRLEWGFK